MGFFNRMKNKVLSYGRKFVNKAQTLRKTIAAIKDKVYSLPVVGKSVKVFVDEAQKTEKGKDLKTLFDQISTGIDLSDDFITKQGR